jgi:pimeloyl-ACP methyl ester carboxylesterase
VALFSRLSNRRDLVFVDQRGTGKTAPLICLDPKRQALADQATQSQQVQQLMLCKAALLKQPHIKAEADLAQFTTPLAMQDLDAVRQQLGVSKINLVGVSYGTRAALEYMRQFPNAVRRSVLDAVAPADMALPASFSTDGQAALDALLTACSAEQACAQAHPQLRVQWADLLKSLPRETSVIHPLTGERERLTLSREMVLGIVRGALYTPSVAAALPVAITEAAAGRYEAIAGLGSMFASKRGTQLAMGMHFSVICAEDVPRLALTDAVHQTNPAGVDFRTEAADLYRHVCARWPRGELPADYYKLPAAKSPVLMFSGGIDPATPNRHGARVAKSLGDLAKHLVLPNAGHGVLSVGCARDVIYRFIDASNSTEALSVDTRCLQNVPRPNVFRPIQSVRNGYRETKALNDW